MYSMHSVTDKDEKTLFHMTDTAIEEMMKSGLYRFWFFGHVFLLRFCHLLLTHMVFNSFNRRQIPS